MKKLGLFLREHVPFLIFQVILMLFIMLLYWLDGFRNFNTAVYSISMSMLLTSVYLLGKYIMRRTFYEAITRKPEKMEDALIRFTQAPEHRQTTEFTRELYRLYQNEVQRLYAAQHRQLHFMNQWVHQMKTPISVMGLLLQEKDDLDRDSITEEVEKIRSGLDLVLVNARLETFEQDMQIERVGLKKLVQEIVTEHKRLFITNGVFPVISIDDNFFVATDAKWMKIVIGQFITNAVKYTFDEGKKVHLIASCTGDGLQLSIQDEGIGIPTSDLKRVTKAFFTGENGRLIGESTGMGLYIASEVCDRLGHPLSIKSQKGKGTTVTVLFENGEAGEMSETEHNRGIDGSNENL
ncbi:HAMP domain-containing histidine kinase [Sporosarcina sp. ANT_H38]|uniref:sensor histidine kinase n=1 Tax=Sporosarcina sp. ANT_H38 TaxID=2597358 RepID=UPI0011F0EC6A|nr:sensor histidine kinase [Sporosarcina sp. ANT_H38]KAA0966813.1 HAMP domain-containing histidine kinase [Sporosarcina sp. ANT_H38]